MFPTKYMQKERTTLEDTFVNELISYHFNYLVPTAGVTISLKKALKMFIHPLFQLIREKISIRPRKDDPIAIENGSSTTTSSGLCAWSHTKMHLNPVPWRPELLNGNANIWFEQKVSLGDFRRSLLTYIFSWSYFLWDTQDEWGGHSDITGLITSKKTQLSILAFSRF